MNMGRAGGGAWLVAALAMLTGCSANRVGLVGSPAIKRHFAQGQVTDVTISLKQVGDAQGVLGKRPMKQSFLEGFIEGAVTEWDGEPASGVAVRVEWDGWANPAPASGSDDDRAEAGQALVPSLTPDDGDARAAVMADAQGGTAVTDKDGRYRVPFAVPLRKGRVEGAGRLVYSPDWGAQFEKLGRAYEPYAEEVPFQLFYYHGDKILAYNEGYRRIAVRLREEERSRRSAAAEKKMEKADKTSVAALWLDLQLALVKHRLEKEMALSKSDDAVHLALPEPLLFPGGGSDLSKVGRDRLAPVGKWIASKRCRLTVQVTPGNDPGLAQRRAAEIKAALMRAGVPEARFLPPIKDKKSTGATLRLIP